ncbi:ScbA/BarX family gamma-butyrolactone biosynthesis protein [Streptomyces sp. NBC_01465]|uniref:ScbA/BarX family gamma-butyrolactone biosynthesis protein n=1 Tax=Streptomyces sp. NBC_01465 TaxID=2903878 RepID=UPI002E33E0FF|nr:ScbA/BarX family gamma-butyrolactone biosynthesis protein [Streptomyces sp. NBC_01465]
MTATTVETARPESPLKAVIASPSPLLMAIPRQYVHKAAQAEVLLCGWQENGEDSFVAPAQWPRSHSFYTPAHGLYDPMLFAESVRQAIPLVSHVGYGAPMDHRQIWDYFRCTVSPEALLYGRLPADSDLHLTGVDVVRRAGRLGGMTLRATAMRGTQRMGVTETRFANQAPAIYRRLRGPRCDAARAMDQAVPLPAPIAPDQAGRINPQDVVLAPGRSDRHWQLRVDVAHPVLFDHAVDHIPGMVLLEAARQAAHSTLHPRQTVMTGIDAKFTRFVEFDAPCWIEAEPAAASAPGHETVRITARQGDQVPFTATVTSLVVPR